MDYRGVFQTLFTAHFITGKPKLPVYDPVKGQLAHMRHFRHQLFMQRLCHNYKNLLIKYILVIISQV